MASKKEIKEDKNYKDAYDVATKIYKKFRNLVKSIVLFGSTAKHETTKKSDIDILIIIDDCIVDWDEELIGWYRGELSKLIEKEKNRDKIHVTTVTLTTFWAEIKAGEPMVINVLRYGESLIDVGGFFEPLKVLLARGKIRPSPEAVYTVMSRSYEHLWRANQSILASVESNFWAIVDASHALLMAEHITPPSPEHIAELLDKHFVKRKLLNKNLVSFYEQLRKSSKEITHGDKSTITEREFKEIRDNTQNYVDKLMKLTKALIKDEKIIRTEKKNI